MVKQISLAEVKEHNKASDLWVVIENKVYDLTKFRDEHPGGEEVLVEVAGRDATKDFDEVGHSQDAKDMMKKYCIGELEDKNTEMQLPVSTNIANNSNTTNAQMPNELYPKNKCCDIS
ncbi:cytochrome b5 isoform X1 [Glossina fuscipes]|uniref:Cytochrome b5 n=1 Tax=Glossina fuscipes TaxID=7396 RepID=A0A9C5ZAA1_9MUSC|nr:cytochrome b5 isoform X1 [Glossina fuscipes]